MIRAFGGALSLALTLLILWMFFPEIAAGLVQVLEKMIQISIILLDQVLANLPQ